LWTGGTKHTKHYNWYESYYNIEIMFHSNLVVLWRISEACDLPCPFCAYSRKLQRARQSVEAKQVLDFGRVLGEYASLTGREVMMSWLGGEPLLWKPLFNVGEIFRQEYSLRLSLTTNGTHLGDVRVREHLLANYDEITISLDGLGVQHDEYRQTPGLYAKVEANVRQLVAARAGGRPRVRINTILMRGNIEMFEALCEAVAGWGVDEITFNALGGRDRPEYFPEHHLLPEQLEHFRQALPGIRARMAVHGLTILGNDSYLERLQASAANAYLTVEDCAPGQEFLFINEQGVVSPCSFTASEYGVPVHDLKTADDLQRLPLRFAQRRREALAAVCHDCPSTQVFGKFAVQTASPLPPTPSASRLLYGKTPDRRREAEGVPEG
jgi:MoaA/NifB/PqqE/SkfB family radical SAM enzyme